MAFAYDLALTLDNTGNSAALFAYQMPFVISSTQYNALKAACRAGLEDVQAANGLPWWLEGDDTSGGKLYITIKVPYVAAGASRVFKLSYGDASHSVSTSSASSVFAPPSAPTSSDVYTDSATYNAFPTILRLEHQAGQYAWRNGYFLASFLSGGANSDQIDNGHLRIGTLTAEGGTWSFQDLLGSNGNYTFPTQAFFEDTDGTLYLAYSHGVNIPGGIGVFDVYVTKSTDGGQTWNVGSCTALPHFFSAYQLNYGNFYRRANGDLVMPWNGSNTLNSDWRNFQVVCPSGQDPTVGSNWALQMGTIGNAQIAYDPAINFSETTVFQRDSNPAHKRAIFRNDTSGTLINMHTCTSDDEGLTWTSPVVVDLPAPAGLQKTAPWAIYKDGIVWLMYGTRGAGGGQMLTCSYDGGVTWEPPWQIFTEPTTTGNYGYGSFWPMTGNAEAVQRLVMLYDHFDTPGAKIMQVTEPIDHYLNAIAFRTRYDDFESGSLDGTWSHVGGGVSFSSSVKHSGSKSLKFDNSSAVGWASLDNWPYNGSWTQKHGAITYWQRTDAIANNQYCVGGPDKAAGLAGNAGGIRAYIGPNNTANSAGGPWPFTVLDNNATFDPLVPPASVTAATWVKVNAQWKMPASAPNVVDMKLNAMPGGTISGTMGATVPNTYTFENGEGSRNANLMYLDDVGVMQWTPVLPVFSVASAAVRNGLLLRERRRSLAA